MSLFNKFFKKDKIDKVSQPAVEDRMENPISESQEAWEELPAFIETDAKDYPLVSLIATAIATGDQPSSQFVVKRILKRNPEVRQVSLIAASIAAGDNPETQHRIRKISKRK